MITNSNYYFLLPFNPWPLMSSFFSFNLFFSLILIMKYSQNTPFFLSLVIVRVGRFFWWFSYRGEINLEGKNSLNLEAGVKFAIILFISSEVFFFFSFFWSYFHFFLGPSLELGAQWPPTGVLGFDCLNVPLINTLTLLGSGVTVTLSHNYVLTNRTIKFNIFLITTVMLGLIFTSLQGLEYNRSFFSMRDGSYGTVFFILTGFHGIHVLIGTIFLGVSLYRSICLSRANINYVRFELASWYWHFVDVVWIFLYFFLYYMNQ